MDKDGNDITSATHIGNLNPFRYRGYYYDTETGLYYLQTRYYDPELGRFISQDSLEYADPETINGLNLFAYCANNPIKYVDPTGCSWSSFWSKVGRFLGGMVLGLAGASLATTNIIPAIFEPLGVTQITTVICEFGLTIGMYGAALMGSVFDSEIYSDMELIGWNPYNTNEMNVIASQKMSFYKGVPVIRSNMGSGRSGSFGIILLDSTVSADTVRHEFGHVPQLMILGVARYGLCIGIPSMNEWYKRTNWTYYEAPWDAGADYFGGVKSRTLTKSIGDTAIAYHLLSLFLGPIVHSFYKKL